MVSFLSWEEMGHTDDTWAVLVGWVDLQLQCPLSSPVLGRSLAQVTCSVMAAGNPALLMSASFSDCIACGHIRITKAQTETQLGRMLGSSRHDLDNCILLGKVLERCWA